MFDEHAQHEMGLKRLIIPQLAAERLRHKMGFITRVKLRKNNGATVFFTSQHLDRKVRHIYPRGNAFERIVLLPSKHLLNRVEP